MLISYRSSLSQSLSLVELFVFRRMVVLVHLVTELLQRDLSVVAGVKLFQMVFERFLSEGDSGLLESRVQKSL